MEVCYSVLEKQPGSLLLAFVDESQGGRGREALYSLLAGWTGRPLKLAFRLQDAAQLLLSPAVGLVQSAHQLQPQPHSEGKALCPRTPSLR